MLQSICKRMLVLGLLGAGGCISLASISTPKLEFVRADDSATYSETFKHAYATQSEDGIVDIVLLNSGTRSRTEKGDKSVLLPTSENQVSQIVHMTIFWRPPRGAKANSPAATNASIHLYIIAKPLDPKPSFIEYSGAGFVRVSRDPSNDQFFDVDVINADLHPTTKRGPMNDPLGMAKVQGAFSAKIDPAEVASVIKSVPK